MGIAFWIRRTVTAFTLIAAVLFVVSLLKGRGLAGSVSFTAVWATASTALFIGARLYQSSRGQHCEICQDIPSPRVEPEEAASPASKLPRPTALLAALLLCACSQEAASTGLTMPHPDDPSKQVEYVVRPPTGDGPWPTVVFLHGHQDGERPGGKAFARWGVLDAVAERGYLAVAVSQPGYGHSDGPADFSGPFTQHAVSGVIASLRANGLSSPDRLVIQGISRGAITAGLVAAEDTLIAGLVLISGAYDLAEYVADPDASQAQRLVARAIRAETGGSDEAVAARSVLRVAGRIRANTLILNGAQDDRTGPDQTRRLAEKIRQHGGTARAVVYPDYGHQIPVEVRARDVDPFVDSVLGAERPSR